MNPLTTVLPPFLLEKKLEAAVSSWRERASHPIAIQLWNGKRHALGDTPKLVLHIRSPKTLARLMEPSLATLGAAYVEGELDFEGHMRDAIDTIARFIAALTPAHRRARPRQAAQGTPHAHTGVLRGSGAATSRSRDHRSIGGSAQGAAQGDFLEGRGDAGRCGRASDQGRAQGV